MLSGEEREGKSIEIILYSQRKEKFYICKDVRGYNTRKHNLLPFLQTEYMNCT